MTNSKTIALICEISRGGFTGERVFRVVLANGTPYVGACPRQYCYKRTGQLLKENEPAKRGDWIDGLVLARHVRDEAEDTMLVSVPDGEVLLVSAQQVREAPRNLSPDVLVQP